MKFLLKLLVLLLVPPLVLGGLYAWVVLRSPAADSGPLVRTSERKVLWKGDPVPVRLHLNGDRALTPPIEPEGDVRYATVLVIDHSGSMGSGTGSPLESALQAAGTFARVVASPAQPVGALAFDHGVAPVHEISPDGESAAAAILSIPAGGGTDVAAAVTAAHRELESSLAGGAYGDARPMIVLLSDGRSDRQAALRAARSAADAGVRILTIGLGSQIDEELLEAMAASPADYRHTLDAGSLGEIFMEIAGDMAAVLGHSGALVERYHHGAFTLAEAAPGFRTQLDVDQGQFRVDLPVVFAQRVELPYTLRARKFGLFSVALGPAELTYLPDPQDPSRVETLVSNDTPPVLVISPLLLLLLFLPLLSYLGWRLLKTLQRPKPVRLELKPPVRTERDRPAPLPLERPRPPGPRLAQPTLFVGLGQRGEDVLVRVAERLAQDRYLTDLETLPFRFLQIDGRRAEVPAAPDNRLSWEKARLPAALAARAEKLERQPQLPEHLRWLPPALDRAAGADLNLSAGSRGNRWLARLALFSALAERDPAFFGAWRRAGKWIADQPAGRIVVAGALDSGTGGGLMSDVAYLLQAALPAALRARIPIYALGIADLDADHPHAAANQWAFLEELNRELLAGRLPQARIYDPAAGGAEAYLNGRMESPVHAGVLLLQAPNDDPAESREAFLAQVAALGHTLTEQSLAQEVQRHLDGMRPLEQRYEVEQLSGVVESAGIYEIRFPLPELISRLADRLVLEVVGQRLVGLEDGGGLPALRREHLEEAARLLEEAAGHGGRLYRVFCEAAMAERPEAVVTALGNELVKAGGADAGAQRAAMGAIAERWCELFLNGSPRLTPAQAAAWRPGRIALLHALLSRLIAFGEEAGRFAGARGEKEGQNAVAVLEAIQRIHHHLLGQVDRWLEALIDRGCVTAGEEPAVSEGLCRRAEAHLQLLDERLARERDRPWQIVLDDETGNPAYAEETLYRTCVEEFLERESGFLLHSQWQFDAAGPGEAAALNLGWRIGEDRVYRPDDEGVVALLADLRAVAESQCAKLTSASILDKLRTASDEFNLEPLARWLADESLAGGLDYDRQAPGGDRIERRILVLVPRLASSRRQELEAQLERLSHHPVHLVEHRDPLAIRLIVLDAVVPISTIRLRRMARDRDARESSALIFLPEREGERLRGLIEQRLGVVPCPEFHPFTRLLVTAPLALGDQVALLAEDAVGFEFVGGREVLVITDGTGSEAILARHQTGSYPLALLHLAYGVRGQGKVRAAVERFHNRSPGRQRAVLEAAIDRWQQRSAELRGPDREILDQILLLARLELDLKRERPSSGEEVRS